jgi:hypothetical protein
MCKRRTLRETTMSYAPRFSSRKSRVVVGLVAVLVAAGGAATAAALEAGPDTANKGPSSPTTYAPTVAQTAPPASNISAALARLPWVAKTLTDVTLGQAPPDVDPGPNANTGGQWLYATVAADSSDEFESTWKADLAQGALAEVMAPPGTADLSDVIRGGSVTLTGDDGKPSTVLLGAGSTAPGQEFGAADESDATIEAEVDAVLAQYDLTPASVQVIHPLGPAIAVVATAQTVEAIGPKFQQLEMSLSGSPANYEGLYIRIELPTGETVAQASAAFRTGGSRLSVDPADDAAFGLPDGGGDIPDPSQLPSDR